MTMVITDDFVIGVEVMFHSLREHSRIRREFVVMVTSTVSSLKRKSLESVADRIVEVRPQDGCEEQCCNFGGNATLASSLSSPRCVACC